ncbi:hypothetical protein EV215_0261 [Hypnocyclicus thermotrophus]|uniref:Uncharacterized protein n=1 Tax=Hypnocyclicus thermotrophus TaxID=1627895 RepID=A0AA46E0C2_9FUSO|nr:hypothetical protein [Hypnocyclicus thermotrophus]TDT72455.1 hypothetical protein EV215_0261 [Hypnocyclicus thermotrophus]
MKKNILLFLLLFNNIFSNEIFYKYSNLYNNTEYKIYSQNYFIDYNFFNVNYVEKKIKFQK